MFDRLISSLNGSFTYLLSLAVGGGRDGTANFIIFLPCQCYCKDSLALRTLPPPSLHLFQRKPKDCILQSFVILLKPQMIKYTWRLVTRSESFSEASEPNWPLASTFSQCLGHLPSLTAVSIMYTGTLMRLYEEVMEEIRCCLRIWRN